MHDHRSFVVICYNIDKRDGMDPTLRIFSLRRGTGGCSRKHQREVFEFVLMNRERMPRTALRYAIELMPEGMRKEAMRK